ncbi:MAG: condensation domain-containing protein [Cyanobacteria bacterium P01_G01_bin.49]
MEKEQLQGFRLSPQQKHLWLSQQRENILPYRVQCAVTITGNLNIEVLKTALQNIVDQHEILRTRFRCLPGMIAPLQVIADTDEVAINELNLIGLSRQEQQDIIELVLTQSKEKYFQFEERVPLQINLLTLSPKNHILILSLSALIADRFSLKLLVEKISCFYEACLEDKYLIDEIIQYADIAEWQNEILESPESEFGKEYWRKQNISLIDQLKPWFEKKQTVTSQFEILDLVSNISSELLQKIELLTEAYKVNLSDFLLTCWLILIGKITRRPDIFVAITADGRKHEQLKEVLAPLAKQLPLSYYLEAESKFRETLQEINDLVNNYCEFQEYFTLEETAQLEFFYPVAFEFEESPEQYSTANLLFSCYQEYSCTDQFKLKLSCLRKNQTLITQFYFDSNLYNLEDIITLSEQFQNLLASAAAANPETSIGQLNILSSCQKQQLLVEFNNTQKS